MSLNNINVEWKVEAATWTQLLTDSIDCPPIEIATKIIENTSKFRKAFNTTDDDYVLGLGIILMVSHNHMKSPDEIFVCHTPTVLANAGLHNESQRLQNMIDRLLKS